MDKNSQDAYNEAVNNVNEAKNNIVKLTNDNNENTQVVEDTHTYEYARRQLNQESLGGQDNNNSTKKPKNKKKKGKPVLKVAGYALLVGVFGVTVGIGNQFGEQIFSETSEPTELASGSNLNTSNNNVVAEEKTTDLSNDVNTVVKNVNSVNSELKDSWKSVVCVNSVFETTNPYFGTQEQSGSGSAVFYAEDGDKVYLLTNNHVIDGASKVTISMDSNNDDVAIDAHLVGTSPDTDIAVIYVDKADLEENNIDYKIIPIGDSDKVEPLDTVYVIGNAAGEGKTITSGIVSAVNKTLETQNGSQVEAIQTDASVNPGNSGGAMVDTEGKLIGINFAKLVDNTIEGMGFAIPVNLVTEVADGLIESYNPDKVFLGISGATVTEEMIEYFNLPAAGIYVADVVAGSGAQLGGLQAGDVIVGVDDVKVAEFEDLSNYLNSKAVGDTITVYFYRNNQPTTTDIVLTKFSDVNSGF